MAISDITSITSRVIFLLGAQDSLGSFDGTTDDDRFDEEEIERAVIETESELMRDLAETYHPFRSNFLEWSGDLAHGDTLPAHLGQVEAVQIKPYSSASDYISAQSESREMIRLFRQNYNNRFDSYDHDEENSQLAGYFCLTNNTLEFTGASARVKTFSYTPDYDEPSLQIDAVFDGALVAGAIGKLHKIGVPDDVTMHYSQQYSQMRQLIRTGVLTMPEINTLQEGGR